MSFKELRISIRSTSFLVSVDEFPVVNSIHKRYRVVGTNRYFIKTLGNSIVTVELLPTAKYSPETTNIENAVHHQELLDALYQAIAIGYGKR